MAESIFDDEKKMKTIYIYNKLFHVLFKNISIRIAENILYTT